MLDTLYPGCVLGQLTYGPSIGQPQKPLAPKWAKGKIGGPIG